MEDMLEQADRFVEAVRNSSEYIEFQEKLRLLKEDESLYHRFNDFRKERFMIMSGGQERSSEELKMIGGKYNDVIQNPIIQDFLVCEGKLFKSLRNLNTYVLEHLGIGIDFLEG